MPYASGQQFFCAEKKKNTTDTSVDIDDAASVFTIVASLADEKHKSHHFRHAH